MREQVLEFKTVTVHLVPTRLRDGPGHWDAGRDARTRILGAGIQGANVFVLLAGTRIPVITWDSRPLNWDAYQRHARASSLDIESNTPTLA